MRFEEKLVILRKLKGITQDEFASAVGVSRQAVYKWESGQSYPEVPKLIEMKLLFSISIDDLLDENFEIALPEKKKRRRKLSKEAIAEIEKNVQNEVKVEAPKAEAAPAPKAAAPKTEAAPAPKAAAPKAAPAPKVEEAPKAEAPVKKEAPVAKAPEAFAKEEKKGGLFGRLFGKK